MVDDTKENRSLFRVPGYSDKLGFIRLMASPRHSENKFSLCARLAHKLEFIYLSCNMRTYRVDDLQVSKLLLVWVYFRIFQ